MVIQLQNLANQTQRNYLQSVKGLACFYQKSPDTITKEMIEDYLLYLKKDKDHTSINFIQASRLDCRYLNYRGCIIPESQFRLKDRIFSIR